jgi:regulator of protease activity HflC (stomatin/prohibitin superfamily)
MLISAAYGIWNDLLVLRALALDAALAALAVWLCLNACRLRRRAALAETPGQQAEPQSGASTVRFSRWEATLAESRDAEETVGPWDVHHARKLHYLFLAVIPTALILLLALRGLWTSAAETAAAPSTAVATALALVCLAASCVWLVLGRSYASVASNELPENASMALAFRDVQWASILAAAALLSSWGWPAAAAWAGRVLLVWVLVVGGEQLVRLLIAWLQQPAETTVNIPPLRLVAREAVFVHGNPVRSFFDALESHFGVSFRSSWAIQFVRRSVVPAALLVALLLWGLSSLAVVRIDEFGVRESFGQVQAAPLPPGLHWKLPWPLGQVLRYPVKRVSVKPIGFVSNPGRQSSFLWSKKHAQEEFALVLGDGSELVAVGCVVYYKIAEDPQGFLDYVYRCQNPDDALEAYAYRALMEQTRSTTLREVLTANRARFAERLKEGLRQYAESNRLGIEVVDVALMGLHPPVEAAADYLDVISARIDAERVQVEARGKGIVQIEQAQQGSASAIASARVESARRTGEALNESSQFIAIGQAYSVAPEAFQLRLWFEAFEEILEKKRFVLVDQAVAAGPGGILLDQRNKAAGEEDPVPLTPDAGFPSPNILKKKGQ